MLGAAVPLLRAPAVCSLQIRSHFVPLLPGQALRISPSSNKNVERLRRARIDAGHRRFES